MVEAGQVSDAATGRWPEPCKVAHSSYIRWSRFGDWQRVAPKLSGGLFAKRRNIIDLAVPFHPRKDKDNAPALLWFSKSIFRFHDPFCLLPCVRYSRKGAPKALVDPVRKLIVYPSLLRNVRASWNQAFGAD